MVRPGFHVDEDWAIHLYDQADDNAWEVDDSQERRVYVGSCSFEKLDPDTERRISLRISGGRIRLPMEPPRFRVQPRVQSPIRWAAPSESDPSEDIERSVEPIPSESVDSPPTREPVVES